ESRVGANPIVPWRRRYDDRSHTTLRDAVLQVLRTFGRVPLFFYILHIYLAHFASGMVGLMLGRGLQMFVVPLYKMPAPAEHQANHPRSKMRQVDVQDVE